MSRWSFIQSVKKRYTLRTRLALWVMGLLLVISIGLLVLVNVATPIKTTDSPKSVMVAFPYDSPKALTVTFPPGVPTPVALGSSYPVAGIISGTPIPEGSDGSTVTIYPATYTINFTTSDIEKVTGVSTSTVKKDVFHEMRVVSIIGLGVVVLLGGLVAYWLAGRALRPVKSLAQAAQGIDAETLDTRLNLKGPEDELRQLSDSFDSMLNRLECSFEQQGRFVADASHELRNPLATLRSNLNVVSADPGATVENYREMSLTLERAIARLQRVVDDLLLLATEERPLPDTPVVLEPIVEETMTDLKPLADEHSVNLKYESCAGGDGLMIQGNPELLMRVFHNLIENGIRYNKPDGEVVVRTIEEDGWAVITVKDTGIGIASEQLPHIFDRFYRVDSSRDRNSGGSGLGLSIVAYVLHLHKGQIEVESTVGVGTTFTVKLPLSNIN